MSQKGNLSVWILGIVALSGSSAPAHAMWPFGSATTVMEVRTYGGFDGSPEVDVRLLTNGNVIRVIGKQSKKIGELPGSRVSEIQKRVEALRSEELVLDDPDAKGCEDAPSTTYIAYTERGESVRLGERIGCLLTRNRDYEGSKLLEVLIGMEKLGAL